MYACLNFECQDQFVAWVSECIKSHLLLTALLSLACLLSIQIAYKMKNSYQDSGEYTQWHDDISLGMSVFSFLAIILGSYLFA